MKLISADELLEAASKKTGLDNYGDMAFLEPLKILMHALSIEARLNEMGIARALFSLRTTLETRLQVEDYLRQRPEVKDVPVERPLFIVGLPRTATTVVQHLLDCDSGNHTLRLWEGNNPVPPPEDESYDRDPRIAASEQGIAAVSQLMPGFERVHMLGAKAPDECLMLLNRAFVSVEFLCFFNVPSYRDWLFAQDLRPAYRYYQLQLQLLQSKKSGLWALKAPMHRMALDVIFEIFPDAIAIETHRDLEEAIPSGCNFLEVMRRSCSDVVDSHEVAKDWLDLLHLYCDRFQSARKGIEKSHSGQLMDVEYQDILEDPIAVMHQIYQFSGRTWSAELEQKMRDWLLENPQNKHGKHEYNSEQYGLEESDLRAFRKYV